MLLSSKKGSEVRPAVYQACQVNQPEERERFGATILNLREKNTTAAMISIHENVDWKYYDGGIRDGECPSVSAVQVGGDIDYELDCDEEDEDL
ncbi:hypothetical protein NDU88_000218 [Pleurodeles waltl]|uniref:Uncharacterized protein n=1 Tax=Pleurodeles waltl TaxID=8319 RepID=A0AAV7TEG8_PLEWA|nr:hypothetical protein NDU88_000218 [Pleurodeles waltl]